ncbi:alpha-amylase family glycosyl hydrolase [Agathobacter rectalis]|uniref:alpha-amylase family glycosyl hydrolase n=1 Tax=Agathobacter rectalis TaxID=39491 RepID=UPI0027D2E4FD|nr:alpha-amylase family glycosyl hydrolase [Agathobacter rectalis]
MRKLKERFHRKHGIFRQVFSLILVLAMIMTMIPSIGGMATAYADDGKVSITLHFKNYGNWNEVATKATETENWTSISGYEQYNAWPGVVLSEDTEHKGYYTLTVTKETDTQFNCIFNNNGNNSQTSNIIISASELAGKTSYEGWVIDSSGEILKSAPNSWTTPGASDLSYVSPEVNGRKVTFRVPGSKFPGAEKVTVPGDMNNWKEKEADGSYVLTKNDAGMWTGTFTMAPGVYGYKFVANESWNSSMTDPANSATTDGNSKLVVPGLEDKVIDAVKKNEATKLPATLKCYAKDGTVTDAPVDYSLKAENENVSLSGNTITVKGAYAEKTLALDAKTADGKQSTVTLNLVDKTYTYTIYYYDFNEAHMSTSAADLWLWETSGAGAKEGTPFTSTEKLSDGNTWLKTVVTLSYTNVSIIPRAAGGWSWQSNTIEYVNTDGKGNVTLYITSNGKEAYTSIPELVAPRERYVMVEYDRPAGDYDGWNIFTWNSGFGDKVTVNFQKMNGKMVAKIPVKDTTADMMLSFCMRRSTADNEWADKDGGDHYVSVPANQNVVKAKFVQGEGITEVLPSNIGCVLDGENGQIHFYYRDDEMVAAKNTQKSIADRVSVTINGKENKMAYDAANERFYYDLTDIKTGDYCYYYTVDGKEKLDAFNEKTKDYKGKKCSYRFYKKFDAAITAELSKASMDYNDNNVLTIKTNPAKEADMSAFEVATATVDLSALGLSSTYAIDPELMEVSISCLDTTTAGNKTLPVTVKDIYGNVYRTSTNVTVTERNKKDGDFDWDEAVIYFAVTDRFFDGNTSNNDAYGVKDYNTGDKGGSSYHGGDFAGLTQKLDYLKDLGVNTIWITPIVENITSDQHDADTDTATYGYHGYWASDFTKLNKHLGTEEEFAALIDAAHSRGMKLMVDVVLNHAGYGTEKYFNNILEGADGKKIKMLRDSSNTVSGDDKQDALSDLPDFVTEDAEVRNQLIKWQTDWMEKYKIDYYRVDTVKHVDSTTWSAFKNSLTKVNPDFKMIGEYSGAGYANTAGELGTGSMDALLDFDFNDFAKDFVGGKISTVENSLLKRNAALNNTATMGNFLNNHDDDTLQELLVKKSGLSAEEAYNLMKVAATLQITAKGQPVIYYGDELGQAGANDWPYQTNRRDFDWTELEAQKTNSNSIYNHYKTMLSIRNAYTDVFARGSRTSILSSDEDGYDVIARSYGDTTLYVGMNINKKATEVTIPVSAEAGSKMENLYDGNEYTVSADKTVTVSIPAAKDGGTVILTEVKKTVDPTPADPGKKDPTPTPAKKDGVISVTDKAAIETKKAAPKSGDDNEAATYVCLLGLAMVAITAATYRKKKACK